jgi:TRAP-type C4-dicarboxylate transport system permease small subunit
LKYLLLLAKAAAVFAGMLLTLVALVVCASVIGRNLGVWTLVGDFELTASVAGAVIALFFPYCQATRGNVILDFFTLKASASTRERLDRLGALAVALVLGLMTWRGSVGLLSAWETQAGSMMLGFPEWIVYACIVPALGLTALIALTQAVRGFEVRR